MQETVIRVHDKQFKKILSEEEIRAAIKSVAKQINSEYNKTLPIILIMLKGACLFAADLMRMFSFPCEIQFAQLSSYQGTSSSETVSEQFLPTMSLSNRRILIIDDIIDSGLTARYIIDKINSYNPTDVKIAVFCRKPVALKYDVTADYVAMEIPNRFVIGYGMDYNQLGRNLKDIYEEV